MKANLALRVTVAAFLVVALPSTGWCARSSTEKAGDALRILLPLTGLGFTLVKSDTEGQWQFWKSLGTTVVVTEALKAAISKKRPNGECCDAFPSGHASAAFEGASFLERRYGWTYGLPAYAAATFVAYSRVHADKHDVADVTAGAAIGILSSYYFATPYKGVEITPLAGDGVVGVELQSKW